MDPRLNDSPNHGAWESTIGGIRALVRCNKSVAMLLIMMLMLSAIAGCGYPEVSPATYEYAKALYSIANRKATDQLESVKSQVTTAVERGDVSAREARWLMAIIDDASAGQWQEAAAASRRIMEDQTG